MSNGKILTIILNFRTPEMTTKCAEAALAEMEDLPGEVLVIENGSGDGSMQHLETAAKERGWTESGKFRLICSPVNGGFGAGMNIGFRAGLSDGSRPDFYYLLNSDAFVQGTTISTLRDFLMDHPGAGLAGSYVCGTDGTPHRTAFRFPSIAGEFEMAARTGIVSRLLSHAIVAMEMPKTETQVDWTAGASLMIRREVLEAVGGFDEAFFLYFEETDLCLRAANAGWRTHYIPDSVVSHVGSASTGMKGWGRTPRYWFDSRHYYFTKSKGSVYAVCATLARLSGCALYGLRRLIQGKPQADPPRFARDLAGHAVRSLLSRPVAATPSFETRLSTPVAEEPK